MAVAMSVRVPRTIGHCRRSLFNPFARLAHRLALSNTPGANFLQRIALLAAIGPCRHRHADGFTRANQSLATGTDINRVPSPACPYAS